MQFWIIQTLNSIAFGGLLFLLSSGFSLAFGLMRIPNLAHGGFFMLGAYFGATITHFGGNFWVAVLGAGLEGWPQAPPPFEARPCRRAPQGDGS